MMEDLSGTISFNAVGAVEIELLPSEGRVTIAYDKEEEKAETD